MKPAVVNASPLIVLGRAGLLELLPSIFSSIVVPRAVVEEIAAGAVDDPLNALLSGARWLSVVETNALLSPLAFARLGRGETEVLEYARTHAGTVAVLDDKAARRAAGMLRLPLTGTLGVLAAAFEAGCLPSFTGGVAAVVQAGLYVDPVIAAELGARLKAP